MQIETRRPSSEAPRVVSIVADDLTGALDAAAPFAARGFVACVATGPRGLEEAIAGRTQVIAVSTGSRNCLPAEAAERVLFAAISLGAADGLAFKKIDSRLKGNVPAEIEAALAGFGRSRAIVCPAIPDLGRTVRHGHIEGHGVALGLSVAEALGAVAARCEIADALDDAALDQLARGILLDGGGALAVGARGLAAALARVLTPGAPQPPELSLPRATIVAIGSRDPITRAQVDRLKAKLPGLGIVSAPNGDAPPDAPVDGMTLVSLTEGAPGIGPEEAARRFSRSVAALVRRSLPEALVLSGGDTAGAILEALGIEGLNLVGEILPGLPYATVSMGGRPMAVVTKSGGFGHDDTLADMLLPASGR
jgi:uncharacterized protein YgbK (DUF1537 family)